MVTTAECSVDSGNVGTQTVDSDDDTDSASDASETSTDGSTISVASNVPSMSLDALSVVAPTSAISTSLLQSAPLSGNYVSDFLEELIFSTDLLLV